MRLITFLFAGFCLAGPLVGQEVGGKPDVQHRAEWDDDNPTDWVNVSGGGGTGPSPCTTSSCPPRNERGKSVTNCWYQKSFSTGWRCIIFCRYSDGTTWGGDGGNNCG